MEQTTGPKRIQRPQEVTIIENPQQKVSHALVWLQRYPTLKVLSTDFVSRKTVPYSLANDMIRFPVLFDVSLSLSGIPSENHHFSHGSKLLRAVKFHGEFLDFLRMFLASAEVAAFYGAGELPLGAGDRDVP